MTASSHLVTVAQLRYWLEQGRTISLLDVRSPADHAEWTIPGSRNVPTSQLLADPDGELAALALPTDRPVVAFCNHGNSSLKAQALLAERGFKAYSLTGGMKAWSVAWNMAEVALPKAAPARIFQFRRTGKGCLSYLVGSANQAVVIDPSLEPSIYLDAAKAQGWGIIASLDTHVHADHVSRARKLETAIKAPICLPETTRVSYKYQPIHDSDALQVGRITLTAMRTPGHTPESLCWRLDNHVLFSGDTLFVDSIGRPDLATNARGAEMRARALWRSLQHLFSLPGHLMILPGHSGRPVPFDGRPVQATLDEVKARVSHLPADEKGFAAAILERIPETPPNHLTIVKLNEKGQFPDGDPTDLEAGANRCAVVTDLPPAGD